MNKKIIVLIGLLFSGSIIKSEDILSQAKTTFKNVRQLAFSPDGKYIAALVSDEIIVKRIHNSNQDVTIKDFCVCSLNNHPIVGIVFGDKETICCRHVNGHDITTVNITDDNTGFFNFPLNILEDPERAIIISNKYDLKSPLSIQAPADHTRVERVVFCPDGLHTTTGTKQIIKDTSGMSLCGGLRLCRLDTTGSQVFCINKTPEGQDRALSIDLANAQVKTAYFLLGDYENPAELLFNKDGDLLVIDPVKKQLCISMEEGEQRVPHALSMDSNQKDLLVVAANFALSILEKNSGKYRTKAVNRRRVSKATVQYNSAGDTITEIVYDRDGNGTSCTFFNLFLEPLQVLDIASLGLIHEKVSSFSFNKVQPNLMALTGLDQTVIIQLPKDQTDSSQESSEEFV